MKIGVKTFDNPDFLREFVDRVDFFEIMAIEGKDYSFLDEFDKPIVIHAQHEGFGMNVSDKSIIEKNIKSINFARTLADKYNASKIIVHPGSFMNDSCSNEQAIFILKSLKDDRIILENLLTLEYIPQPVKYSCAVPENMKKFMKETGKGFCFDINHAICSALDLGLEPYEYLKEFMKLRPSFYHLGGQTTKGKGKTHLSFKDSDIDLDKIMKIIPKDAEVTLEVSMNIEDTKYDVDLIRKLDKKR